MAIRDALSLEVTALISKPVMHQYINFQQNLAMHGWVIDDSTHFPALFRVPNEPHVACEIERPVENTLKVR